MLDGMKYANEGMIQMSIRQDIISNNLANATTAGFRRETGYITSFSSVFNKQMGFVPGMAGQEGRTQYDGYMEVGGGLETEGGLQQRTVTGFSQGALRETGNNFDLALDDDGKGMFTVQTPDGMRYTRNGSFHLTPTGNLATADGALLMGMHGPINVGHATNVEVTPEGVVKADGRELDHLRITAFMNMGALRKVGTTSFSDANAGAMTMTRGICVRQGYLEQGNVNAVQEMVSMLAVSRAFEANQKALQSEDQVLKKAANNLGQVR